MPDLSHIDAAGRARMVDVSRKPATERTAEARARIELTPELRARVLHGDLPKGEAIAVARVAAIQAAKDTARLIPLCHPLPLDAVEVEFAPHGEEAIEVRARARCRGSTGVEMEALTAATVGALTLYDMVKALCREARITDVELLSKSGGKSGEWRREGAQ
ncbi:MAG TPA: cyclic pyranopterin monophosphate synthase MoaC [Planctomycetota bacterium]|nr:cyclic pyranopterin monophosphate synthase MoaC [Planctomycetota bacterium]